MQSDKYLTKARQLLALKPIFEFDNREIQLVLILDQSPPLEAYWHKGKQVHIIAVDVDGNFFLRRSSGAVAYWVHKTATAHDVSASVREFVSSLREDINTSIKW